MTPSPALTSDELASLLTQTSRTFALAIPLLDEPLATDVGLAYLLFRIADTLEDATLYNRDLRLVTLDSFSEWLTDEGGSTEHRWLEVVEGTPPTRHEGYLALLARAEAVKAAALARGEAVATAMTMDVCRTAARMASFVARQTGAGAIVLRDLPDLQDYCYAVAGIVGELLTELFVLREPHLAPARDELMDLAPTFGEGLQLVNILKDAPSDAREGRLYLPPTVSRGDVVRVAREDLERAADYVALLERAGAGAGIRRFCDLPTRLAVATLERLDVGAPKLSREEVMGIFAAVTTEQSA